MNTTNDLYKIAVSLLHGIGPVRAVQLVSKVDDLQDIFELSYQQLWRKSGIAVSLLKEMKRKEALEKAQEQLDYLEKIGGNMVFFTDEDFPRRLRQCPDTPIVLYSKGNFEMNHAKIISVVGTRNITPYGVRIVEELLASIQEKDVLVISGLAYGVDIEVHRKCIEKGIATVGVLGHGLDRLYPSRHKNVAFQMIENGGLLTEFTTKTNPDRENFPMRNRIVAGLSDATIVVESKEKGGSIITANLANDYNRDVFAYPGDIDKPYSTGCNKLILEQKANLITCGNDLLKLMNWDLEKKEKRQKEMFIELLPEEKIIVNLLKEESELHADVLCIKSNFSPSQMNVILFNLEMSNIVQQLPGKRFRLLY